MFTRVSTVLIGKNCPTSYTTADALSIGDVALFDQNKNLITSAANAATASAVYVGVCKGSMNITLPNGTTATKNKIEFSNIIQKASKPSYVLGAYTAPSNATIEIDLTNVEPVIGHRYVVRIVYKDMYEAPGQFTHTYEAVATTEVADDLGNALLKKINNHPNRRVSATFASHKLTLTAMDKDDNEGKDSLSEYSIVKMDATLYSTIPGALLSNQPEAVAGAVITKTEGNPGKGYWKQVRDLEVRQLGYKGQVYTGAYPSIEPARDVTEGATYDYMTIENDNLYLSPDNQYIKTTPLMTELYVEQSTSSTLTASSVFVAAFDAFMKGEAPTA